MSEDSNRQEEREFQLRMLAVQTSIDTAVTYFSLLVAVTYSVSVTLYSIAVTNVPDQLRSILLPLSLVSVGLGIVSTIAILVIHHYSMPRMIQKIREDFVEPLAHKAAKEVVALDKDPPKTNEDRHRKEDRKPCS